MFVILSFNARTTEPNWLEFGMQNHITRLFWILMPETFKIYVRKHPELSLSALLHQRLGVQPAVRGCRGIFTGGRRRGAASVVVHGDGDAQRRQRGPGAAGAAAALFHQRLEV